MAAKEICIAARDFGPGRAQEGDIIWIGEPRDGIGLREGYDFIWLIVDDSILPEPNDLKGASSKFKYNIALSAVRTSRLATFDEGRARDRRDYYQPFRNTDPVTGLHRQSNLSLPSPVPIVNREL